MIIATINIISWFFINNTMWWMRVLHLPLFSISIYAFILSMKNTVSGAILSAKATIHTEVNKKAI
jgi:hypothetical protein